MTSIVDMHKQQLAEQKAARDAQRAASTERAQIVVNYNFPAPAPIYRFNSLKKGQKAYDDMVKAWKAWFNPTNSKLRNNIYEVKADMFVGFIDLSAISAISFVNCEKRDKFIPWE